jgi:hypothetical protein
VVETPFPRPAPSLPARGRVAVTRSRHGQKR